MPMIIYTSDRGKIDSEKAWISEANRGVVYVKFNFDGRLPALNEIVASSKIRCGRYSRYAAEKRAIETQLMCQIRTQLRSEPVTTCTGEQDISFTWVCKDKRRDPDNISAGAKFVLDSLVGAGVLESDGWGCVASISHAFQTGDRDGVVVELHESTG